MMKCMECGAPQFEGALFCNECGFSLLDADNDQTAVLPFSEIAYRPPLPVLPDHELKPPAAPKDLLLVIPNSRRRIKVTVTDQLNLGRAANKDMVAANNLDLSQDGGAENGVSREHATIQISGDQVVLIDRKSTNGTFLNSHRLPANVPHPLQNGDELKFGELFIHIFF